ncbi:probable insulin-like peptide 5 [Musca domestica]|uniref:Probable insulin-like peptide 5 n=1 Tax=Musca domestica TaxID=7370 RepID=A0A9J7DLC3_MUSDO|nr:probable insulin-like peptide 5 [Musca domestica]
MKFFSLILFLVFVHEIKTGSIRVCGPGLAELLDAVCEDGFNGMQLSKKSISKPLTQQFGILNMLDGLDDETPHASNSLLRDILYGEHMNDLAKIRRQRHRTGVYDECCRKRCTTEELKSYCL